MDTNEVDGEDYEQQQYEMPQTIDDNGSSNYGFDDNLTYEQQSNEKEETNQTDETTEQETFIADLADLENANSFPSAYDDNSMNKAQLEVQDDALIEQVDSDSNQIQTDSNDGDFQMVEEVREERNEQTNMVGQLNEMSNDKSVSEDTFAQSEETKAGDQATDLDAENISEDELPAPAKPEVQDAEEVSDEELPGPKMAELPADTEVVSEEELPVLKGKRKHEDYDPSEPTDEADEKKMKTDGKHRALFLK